jgi:hypothetical protein
MAEMLEFDGVSLYPIRTTALASLWSENKVVNCNDNDHQSLGWILILNLYFGFGQPPQAGL